MRSTSVDSEPQSADTCFCVLPGFDSFGPLHEEPYRFVVGKTLHRRWPLGVRQGERRYRILVLSVEPQRYAACGQDLQIRSGRKQLAHRRRRLQKMLEVVHHQEDVLLA